MSKVDRYLGDRVQGLLHINDHLGFRFGYTTVPDLPACTIDREGEIRALPATESVGTRIVACRRDILGVWYWTPLANLAETSDALHLEYVLIQSGDDLVVVTDESGEPVQAWVGLGDLG